MQDHKKIIIVSLLSFFSNSYSNDVTVNLASSNCSKIFNINAQCGQCATEAFLDLNRMVHRKKSSQEIIDSVKIQAFLSFAITDNSDTDACGDTLNQVVYRSQELLLCDIYKHFFSEYLMRARELVVVLVEAKEHWQLELFYELLPWTRKSLVTMTHAASYKSQLKERIKILENLENQMCTSLGIALHGYSRLNKIEQQHDIHNCFLQAIDPIYKQFNVPMAPGAYDLLQDMRWFIDTMYSDLPEHQKIIMQYKKPHHVMRHKVAYGAAAVAALAAFCVYKKHEDQVPFYISKMKSIKKYLKEEYVIKPFTDIANVLWDQKRMKFKELGEPCQFSPCANLIVNNPLTAVLGIKGDADKVPQAANHEIRAIHDFVNQFPPFLNDLVGMQLMTFYLAATIPVVALTGGTYYTGKKLYNRYVKHDSWYKPMNKIVRSIDRLLNMISANSQQSFCDDGKLYLLIIRLQSYMYCLSNEELVLFNDDIADLLSFDLRYAQKASVVERMYKTYEFLKV